ncbi:hypothetical protein [Pseudomonas helmanticensis]|jgi:hypothetical protein|uniref:hypothetical protein n=1 Tax=Pseudomonas helmanticensis TaxID=1471381 RepID=UPI0037F9E96C
MSRTPSDTDFHEEIPGVGQFVFARRTMRDEMRIASEYSRLTEGVMTPTPFLATVAGWIATLKVLIVAAPDAWDLDEMDPLDEDAYNRIAKVNNALRQREGQFRKTKGTASKGAGQAPGGNDQLLVSPQVPAVAD